MIHINLQNIEELLFKNSQIKPLFPEFAHIFEQWLLSYRFPALNTMRKQALLDLLNFLDAQKVEKIAKVLGDIVVIEKLDYHISKNLNFNIDGVDLTSFSGYDNIVASRSGKNLYITLWR